MRHTIWESAQWFVETYPSSALPGSGWDCSVFNAQVVRRAAGLALDPLYWDGGDWWQAVNIWEGQGPMSPMAAYQDIGVSGPRTHSWTDLTPSEALEVLWAPGWYVVQGWRADGTGHQFLVEVIAVDSDYRCWVLESSLGRGVRVNGMPWLASQGARPWYGPSVSIAPALEQFVSLGIAYLWRGALPKKKKEVPVTIIKHSPPSPPPGILIPREVTEEALDEIRETGTATLDTVLEELALATEDGHLDLSDAQHAARAVLDEILEGIAAVADALLPLPEPFETVSDLGIAAAKEALQRDAGPIDDLVDLATDLLDGPEKTDIIRKITKHSHRYRVEGRKASRRKELKHARRLLKHFPEAAASLGITGNHRDKSTIKLGYSVGTVDKTGEIVLLPHI